MISKSSIVLTAVFGASTLMVFGVLTDKGPVPMEGDPIPELDAAEADYTAAQEALDDDQRRLHLTTLFLDPEVRRQELMAWPERNREALEAQETRRLTIEELYDQHRVSAPPTPLEMMAARAPETAAEAASPEGRVWALENEVAGLREAHAQDPEQLRDAMLAWEDAHGEESRRLTAEAAAETAAGRASPPPPVRLTASASLPAGASASEIRLAALQDRLAAVHDADPSPALRVDGPPPTAEEMEAWRERIISLTVPLEEEMRPLSQPLVDRATQQLLEHVHEQLR